MAIQYVIIMSCKTHSALQAYRDHLEGVGYNFTIAEAAGNLISEALQANGFLVKPEYIRQEIGHNAIQS
jgi:hypothetical protein